MAYSYFKYKGDGKTNTFAIPFILGFFKPEDISVRVGDEVDSLGQPVYRTWTFLPGNPGMIQIDGAVPGVDVDVVIKRTVSKTELVHDFQKGEPLDELSLDESHEQLMMAIHELMDGRNITFLEGLNVFGDINMNGYHIRNLTTDKDDPTSAVSYSVIEELETKMDEAAANADRTEAAADQVQQAMGNLFSMSTVPFITEDGVLEYDLGEDIVLNMDANNLLFSLGGVVQQPYVDYELVAPNRIRLKENPGDGLEGWGITCLSFSAPDLSKFLQEIRAAVAKVEEDKQHVDSVAEDIQNVNATAVTVPPGQPASANWDSATNTITLQIPKGDPGDAAIATSTSPGAVIPQTGNEDGLELTESGELSVRHSTATQWGTVLSSSTPLPNVVPVAGEDGTLDPGWIPAESDMIAAFRKSWIGVPRPWRSTTLPANCCWANGDFVSFADWPELKQVYEAGGFAGMLMAWDANATVKGNNRGKWRPDSASPTGLYTPTLDSVFLRSWIPGAGWTAGGFTDSGLPNITGTFANENSGTGASGAIYWIAATSYSGPGGTDHVSFQLGFDASRSSKVYGRSAAVVPPSIVYPMMVYLGNPA